MGVSRVATQIDIAIQGLRLESKRMKVIAENIANARTSRTEAGGPYRRKQVVLETSRGQAVPKVVADVSTAFKSVYEPGNPDADAAGLVRMPNVDLPMELIDMVVASRAYQANAAVLKRYQDMVAATLELLR